MKIKILGVSQDGGVPQINCSCQACDQKRKEQPLFATSILVKGKKGHILIDASPDLKNQVSPEEFNNIKAIILTHAHFGHINGLLQFGFEVSNKKGIKVFASKKMAKFLKQNQPWKQLINNKNLVIKTIKPNQVFTINSVSFKPFLVPHRNEITDTFGLEIKLKKRVLFIPDISHWKDWNIDLNKLIPKFDLAFIDGTFFNQNELSHLPNHKQAKIGHPFITDTIKLLSSLSKKNKNKVNFIHLNHTNLAITNKQAKLFIKQSGFRIANQFKSFPI